MDFLKICCVIVTYNRKILLERCIKAVLSQTVPLNKIIIIDNASTDGTYDYLKLKGLISEKKDPGGKDTSSCIEYERLDSNLGGAGGFYHGLKIAHENSKFNAYWLMDDDGYPSKDCLEHQLPFLSKYDYVMPVSIDIENHTNLSWATRKRDGQKTTIFKELQADWGEFIPFIFPFNGSLMSRNLVAKVGYINPNLFIWGDDYEHYYRCLKSGFTPITVLDAIFYHPVNKAPTVPILFGMIEVPYVNSDLRFVCLIRNWAFINKKNKRYFHLLKSFGAYTWLFLFTKTMNWEKYKLFLKSFNDGLVENFDRHKQFLK